MVKKVGKYELGRTLGEGSFGKVKHAINVETNEAVAIKVLDKEKIQKQNMGNQIKKEISIMKMVKHKYIVGMIEVLASKTKIFIVLDLVTGGELFDKIVNSGKLHEDQALFYIRQLVEGVEYCHSVGVCHRDLKPENLLLDELGNLKISDFGLSSLYVGDAEGSGSNRTEILHTTCGTPNYVAPEVLADQGYDGKKADVWSIGVILYVLLAGFLPFDESTIVVLFQKIQKAEFTYPSWFPEPCRSLIGQMLVSDPSKRLTLAQVKEHPWMKTELSAEKLQEITASNIVKPDLSKINEGENIDDVDDDDDDKVSNKGPISLNAFDLINQCGGFLLDRMLTVPKIVGDLPKLGSFASLNIENKSSSFSGRNTKNIHYTSSIPPVELISAVYQALINVGCTIQGSRLKASQSGKIHATKVTQKGMVAFFLQSFELCPSLSLLAIKRGKGDLLEWNSLFNELVDNYLKDLINKPNEDGEAKSDSSTTGYTPR